MPNSVVQILGSHEPVACPAPVAFSAGFVGMDSWMNFVREVYGFELFRLVSETGDKVTGLLALVHVKHPIFGNYLTTAPFGSYGGFAWSSAADHQALVHVAQDLAHETHADYVNLRFADAELAPPEGWIQHPVYATYLAHLDPNPESLLMRYSSDHRNHVRKSLKKGLSIKFGHLDLLHDAYEGLARSMHELGSPYHSKAYLRAMAESLGDALEFAVMYAPRGQLAGAGVFISQGSVVTNLHANVLKQFRPDYAGEFLYWSVILRYCEKGFQVFDMGRSLIGSGNEVFKSKWGPRKQILAYWYSLRRGASLPELNQKNPKFQAAIWTWKHLPAFVVRPLGPLLIKGLA